VSATSLPSIATVGDLSATSVGGTDPSPAPLRLVGLELSLETASLDTLESVARSITRERIRSWFTRFVGTEEVALLTTCHRVELVLLLRSVRALDQWRDVLPGSRGNWRLREERSLVHHLFHVAAGRESLARGEGEVRHQVLAAGRKVESRHPRPVLRELFGRATAAAAEVCPSVPSSRSIAAVASTRLLSLVNVPLPRVLVIGSGTVGRQVTESLASRARVTLLFHKNPPESSFLRATGTQAQPFERLRHELVDADAAITAAKFGDHGLHAADLPRDRPLLLIDLGMPRNIDPDVRKLSNVRLVDLQNLHASATRTAPPDRLDARLGELADLCSERLELLLLEPWVAALRRAAEQVRRSEIDQARPFLGRLDPSQELAVERLTQRLVGRLLLPPTQRIRSLPPGPEGDLWRRWAVELFRPLPRDP
jgi:glutamyl-tRNA reductase